MQAKNICPGLGKGGMKGAPSFLRCYDFLNMVFYMQQKAKDNRAAHRINKVQKVSKTMKSDVSMCLA